MANTTTLYFTQHFTKGLLKGITINDSLAFVSVERASLWLQRIKANAKRLDYIIVDASFQSYAR